MSMTRGFNDTVLTAQAKPFLKWVGGKRQLLNELRSCLPSSYGRYFEPFLGGGALYFSLRPTVSFLSDLNTDLMTTYQVVRDYPEELLLDLANHENTDSYFYFIRNADRLPEYTQWTPVKKASRLIYLNKTCYNGLYRVNAKGHFNTPFGSYKNPQYANRERILECSKRLQSANLRTCDFSWILSEAKKGDLVYFDPPYVPVSPTASFTGYSQQGFGFAEQQRLAELCQQLDRKGVYFLLSNSNSPRLQQLYGNYRLRVVQANRQVNCDSQKRGKVEEVFVTNFALANSLPLTI